MQRRPSDRPGGSLLGNRVQRTEDPELLTGAARYLADVGVHLAGALHAVFVRSVNAHATIVAVDTADARAIPGVVAVWTAADLELAAHHGFAKVHDDFARPPLAVDRVRFVGEAIAIVIAETRAAAADAASMVVVELDPLPAVVDPEAALAGAGSTTFEGHDDNVACVDSPDAFVDLEAISDVVVRGRYVNQRVAVAPLEPHCVAAAPDGERFTVYPSNQFPHHVHGQLAAALGVDKATLHIVTPRVGGGFGGKAGIQHEYTVVAAAAMRLGRPVVWVPSRSEEMQAQPHGRGQVQFVELGCRRDGTFTGLRARIVGDAGAYPTIGALLPGGTRRMSPGPYALTNIDVDVVVAVTNTTPVGAYRGAGRPEATAMLERVIDQAARQLGIDPIELRMTNLLADDVFPYTTPTGNVYDSGRYRDALNTAARHADYAGWRAEQATRRQRGERMQLGVGVACYVEITSGGSGEEWARVEIERDGSAVVSAGTAAHGQGHQTAYAMLVNALTGIAIERIRLVDGDTDRVPRGGGTGGSRSLQLGGSAVNQATELVVAKARALAANLLEADEADIVIDTATGTIGVAGVPAGALSWGELAEYAEAADTNLDAEAVFKQSGATFPFGAHIAVVEVDTETGRARLIRHVAVDDAGTIVNPLLLEGQQHGGVAAGLGQALYEEIRFDPDGNPITSNFADYAFPSAAEMPRFDVHSTITPSPLNPLGAKGIGEAATIGSTPAIQNAVIDAVAHLGVLHIDMPCTPQRVWEAIAAAAHSAHDPWRPPPAIFATLPKGTSVVDADQVAAADGV